LREARDEKHVDVECHEERQGAHQDGESEEHRLVWDVSPHSLPEPGAGIRESGHWCAAAEAYRKAPVDGQGGKGQYQGGHTQVSDCKTIESACRGAG